MSYDKNSLIRLFDKVSELREGIGWISKKKIDETLKEWTHEDRLQYSQLMEALSGLENIERD